MKTDFRQQVIEALDEYAKANDLNADALKGLTGVSKSYIEAMLSGSQISGKTTIGDIHFKKVAKAIGYHFEPVYWRHVDTSQYDSMMVELMDSKVRGTEKIIIGESRCGKTYTISHFKKKYPKQTYVVTVSSMHNLNDILDDICVQMGIDVKGNKVSKLRKIAAEVKEIKLKGGNPILIIDEAENLTFPALKMTKALYDAFADYCPIILVGTKQLTIKINELNRDDSRGLPQLYYRFVVNTRSLSAIDKDKMFTPFLEMIDDENLKVLLTSLAKNYGMLNRYIEPALREASEMGLPLTEKFFLQFHKQLN
jgi:DNA transposition AAA+ family ATPase